MNKTKSKKVRTAHTDHAAKGKKPASPSAKRQTTVKSPMTMTKERPNSHERGTASKPTAVKTPPLPPRKLTAEEIAHQHSMERYANGLQAFSQNQISKARGIFEKLVEDPAKEIAERARVYLNVCEQRLSHATVQLKTPEELYNHAVGLCNEGNAEEAELYLQKALKLSPKSDHIYYLLATTHAMRDNVDGALENLGKAIELSERSRFQAQNDSDFANLLEDPRFTELLYPEKPIA